MLDLHLVECPSADLATISQVQITKREAYKNGDGLSLDLSLFIE